MEKHPITKSAVLVIVVSILLPSEYMPRNGIAGSYGAFIPSFFK